MEFKLRYQNKRRKWSKKFAFSRSRHICLFRKVRSFNPQFIRASSSPNLDSFHKQKSIHLRLWCEWPSSKANWERDVEIDCTSWAQRESHRGANWGRQSDCKCDGGIWRSTSYWKAAAGRSQNRERRCNHCHHRRRINQLSDWNHQGSSESLSRSLRIKETSLLHFKQPVGSPSGFRSFQTSVWRSRHHQALPRNGPHGLRRFDPDASLDHPAIRGKCAPWTRPLAAALSSDD